MDPDPVPGVVRVSGKCYNAEAVTFTYYYKTSDGLRHEAEIGAPSRDEAFAALRERGVRPIKLVAKDGSTANGEVRGMRKRAVAAIVVAAALAAGAVAFLLGRRAPQPAPVVVTPGNHDLGNRVTRESFLRFRRVFGYDRVTFERVEKRPAKEGGAK